MRNAHMMKQRVPDAAECKQQNRPHKKPKQLRKSAANGRDFVLCKETRPKAYCMYSEGVF